MTRHQLKQPIVDEAFQMGCPTARQPDSTAASLPLTCLLWPITQTMLSCSPSALGSSLQASAIPVQPWVIAMQPLAIAIQPSAGLRHCPKGLSSSGGSIKGLHEPLASCCTDISNDPCVREGPSKVPLQYASLESIRVGCPLFVCLKQLLVTLTEPV